ncbi:MAG: FecR domain-containing protein [Opitutae bacterium]|nr:FecR domain-containing protein [Opitutae bacterium]
MNREKTAQSGDDEAISATAAAWLAQSDDGLSAEEAARLAQWRRSNPRHEAVFTRLEQSWTAMRQLRHYRPQARTHPDCDLLQPRQRSRRTWWPALAATGFAAALAVAFVIWQGKAPQSPVPEMGNQSYATTAGGYQRVVLSDGSVMELNAATIVRVLYRAEERRVHLEQGEAHFTVAKNAARPFWVEAKDVAVRAVGTAFSVRLDLRAVEVLVTEGRVRISQGTELAKQDATAPELWQGQKAVVALHSPASPQVVVLPASELRDALAWQNPPLIFADTPLRDVVQQFNRRNRVQLEIGDAELGALLVGGSFRAENVTAFVRLLVSENDVVADYADAERIVLRKVRP